MPRTAARPSALRHGVFRGRDAVEQGLLTRRQLDGAAWRRVLNGIYVDADTEPTYGLQLSAARLVLPGRAVIAGRSAAWTYGARGVARAGDPVEVLVPTAERFGPVAGLRIRCLRDLPAAAVTAARLTTRERTVADVARWASDLIEAVAVVDQCLAAAVIAPDQLPSAADWLGSGSGGRRARRALTLADSRAASPPESRLRVALTLRGLASEPQWTVLHKGRFVARVDLAYPAIRLAVEYDGAWHAEPGQFGRDRHRLNALVAAGWLVIHVTARDMDNLDDTVERISAAKRLRMLG